ncbi:MAG TPA: hypothetical protein VLJ60_02755, partial [bacterium]|nr:hypothetical protein [bacterium]
MKKHIVSILSIGLLILLYGCSSEYKKENHLRSENVLIEKAIDSFRKNDYVDSMRLTQKLKSMKAKVINEYSKMYLFAIGGDLWYKPFDINSIAKKIPYPTELRETFVEIPILIRVDINGSPDVSIKYNKKIDENAIEYKFFTYFKKHLEKFKIDPTYDLVKQEAVSYNYFFILRFIAPDTISLEKEPHMKSNIFQKEVFNSLPEIMSC